MIDIIVGHWNELFNKEEELSKKRLAICIKCPLLKITSVGKICNPSLYLEPKTNQISNAPREGYYKGCNCRLESKTRVESNHCPSGKW